MTAYDMGVTQLPPRFALTQFTVDEFFTMWPQLEELLDAVPHTWRRLTKEHIHTSVANDLMQMWGIGRPPQATLILLTTVTIFPAMRVLTIVWAAGEFEDAMIPLLDATFTGYARLNGCKEMEVVGRPGWDVHFRKWGASAPLRVWTKEVKDIYVN